MLLFLKLFWTLNPVTITTVSIKNRIRAKVSNNYNESERICQQVLVPYNIFTLSDVTRYMRCFTKLRNQNYLQQ